MTAQGTVPIAFYDTPWSPFKKRLTESRVAVMITGGVYAESQICFYTYGKWRYREITLGTPLD